MNIGMVISLYYSSGSDAAINYILARLNCNEEKAYTLLEDIINSARYQEYVRQQKLQRELVRMHEAEARRLEANIYKTYNAYKTSNKHNKGQQRNKKKNTIVYIDAESVSPDSVNEILRQSKAEGEVLQIRYYARREDISKEAWRRLAKDFDIEPILLEGGPENNKVDNKIIDDIEHDLESNKSLDIVCIATRDGDYTNVVKEIRTHGKRAVVLAAPNTSQKLKDAASRVKDI